MAPTGRQCLSPDQHTPLAIGTDILYLHYWPLGESGDIHLSACVADSAMRDEAAYRMDQTWTRDKQYSQGVWLTGWKWAWQLWLLQN